MKKIISHGAEAIILRQNSLITKKRNRKSYRLSVIDEKLRKQRTKKEAKLIGKASGHIPVPKIANVNDYDINMQFIDGKKLSVCLDTMQNNLNICKIIGESIAKLHDLGIVHGDLTTSNMIYSEDKEKLFFIDFGLGFESPRIEDKAVDLHLIKQALMSKHFKNFESFFETIKKGYKVSRNASLVLKRLEKVEKRGRYRKQY